MERYWGFWTKGKLDILRRYLDAFTTASKSLDERIYLDLFGGQPINRERLTEAYLEGSVRIALSVDSPPLTRLRVFELEPYASRLSLSLNEEFPGRDAQVIAGDCNRTLPAALAKLEHLNWAPTFAFVDPNGPDIEWSTLEALARFKKPTTTKTEIWLLLAAGLFIRTLPVEGPVREPDADKLTKMFGTEDWRLIHAARQDGGLAPGQAREEYVNLMRWRLQHVLGYRWTHPLEVFNEHNHSIYHMIFATDHDAGHRIMSHLYGLAAKEFPAMREQARRLRAEQAKTEAGIFDLFGDDPLLAAKPAPGPAAKYVYRPPWEPLG